MEHIAEQPLGRRDVESAAHAFLEHYRLHGEPLRGSISRLAQASLAGDRDRALAATGVLFGRVIEPLCDAFTEAGARSYRRVFAQIIGIARTRDCCAPFERALAADGIFGEGDLLERVPEHPRRVSSPTVSERRAIRRLFVLSRLTLGADVAITTTMLVRARRLFPNARVSLVGTAAARVLTKNREIELLEVPYARSDTLAGRLNAWAVLRARMLDAVDGLPPGDVTVLDPDSRLTQLGLLPPLRLSRYFHFPSRSYAADDRGPLSALIARWLDETFDAGPSHAPTLEPDPGAETWSRSLQSTVAGDAPLVCVSFGVGGNARKQAGLGFEARMLEWLVRQGCKVLLARGVGADEVRHCRRLAARLAARRVRALHLPEGRTLPRAGEPDADVYTWQADVGAFVAAIRCADFYVGYDSAGQHIAAASGVPTLSLFIESAGRRHAERWAPRGAAPVEVVRARPPVDAAALLDVATKAFRTLRSTAGGTRLPALLPLTKEPDG